jgi:hypothetical protein
MEGLAASGSRMAKPIAAAMINVTSSESFTASSF